MFYNLTLRDYEGDGPVGGGGAVMTIGLVNKTWSDATLNLITDERVTKF